jgi:carbon storage regulator
MLVLSRKIGEKLVIGENIIVVVADVRGDRVQFALEAPRAIPIHRGEVALRIQSEARHHSPITTCMSRCA